jgi:hypothetical protein
MLNCNPKDNKLFACKQRNRVAIGHWETLNGHGEKVRLVRQHVSVKCQGILSPLGRGGMSSQACASDLCKACRLCPQ